uniref:EF-hand domain-containing protein n=1 Tax=Trichobilharzia regenti TaxID=157069 RepID=A0AA85J259_TRIRE|nr:unnamed protein product [Trichobilharzia regenti]
MYDLDNDGYISRQDLIEVLTAIYAMIGSAVEFNDSEATPERRTEKIFQLMDLDRDDRLSLDEFISGVQNDKLLMRLLTLNTHPSHNHQHQQSCCPPDSLINGSNDNKILSTVNTCHYSTDDGNDVHDHDHCTDRYRRRLFVKISSMGYL